MARQLIKRVLDLKQAGLGCARSRAAVTLCKPRPLRLPETLRPCPSCFLQIQHLHHHSRSSPRPTDYRVRQTASLHSSGMLTVEMPNATPKGGDPDDIVTFIKDDGDLERFLGHVAGLLETRPFAAVKAPREDAEAKLRELVLSLLDLRADTRNIFAFLQSNPKVLDARGDALRDGLRFLRDLRLPGNRALLVLDRNPSVWSAGTELLQERLGRLRKLGLVEGSLQRVITAWPAVLTLRKTRLDGAVRMLRRCQFSGRQITAIVNSSPQVLDSDPADIEHRFQYVYFTMGIKSQEDMVRANLYRYSLRHLRQRHTVLERLGAYEVPDKHGRTRVDNPRLARIMDSADARFALKVAGISLEEFRAFAMALDEETAGDESESNEEETDDDNDVEDVVGTTER